MFLRHVQPSCINLHSLESITSIFIHYISPMHLFTFSQTFTGWHLMHAQLSKNSKKLPPHLPNEQIPSYFLRGYVI